MCELVVVYKLYTFGWLKVGNNDMSTEFIGFLTEEARTRTVEGK